MRKSIFYVFISIIKSFICPSCVSETALSFSKVNCIVQTLIKSNWLWSSTSRSSTLTSMFLKGYYPVMFLSQNIAHLQNILGNLFWIYLLLIKRNDIFFWIILLRFNFAFLFIINTTFSYLIIIGLFAFLPSPLLSMNISRLFFICTFWER